MSALQFYSVREAKIWHEPLFFPSFHPTLSQYPGSPVAPIHFLHIFKMDGLDVANSLTQTESRYLLPLRVFRGLEKNQIFETKKRGIKFWISTYVWLNFLAHREKKEECACLWNYWSSPINYIFYSPLMKLHLNLLTEDAQIAFLTGKLLQQCQNVSCKMILCKRVLKNQS